MSKRTLGIKHLASMARSGETFLLKVLASHPDVIVSHNLSLKDDCSAVHLLDYLKKTESINVTAKKLESLGVDVTGKTQLVIKQGVWKHPYAFSGFVLVRNPFSIYCSLKTYDSDQSWFHKEKNFWRNNHKRLARWLAEMQPEKIEVLNSLSPVEQFCFFYNYRVNDLLKNDLPIFRYEDLVSSPEYELSALCDILEIDYYPDMINAHEKYKVGTVGHGKNDMSRAIDQSSVNKCSGALTSLEFDTILYKTMMLQNRLGYKVTGTPSQVKIIW